MKNELMDGTRSIECERCGWHGSMQQAHEEYQRFRAYGYYFKEVFTYRCPSCKKMVAQDIHNAKKKVR